MLPPALLSAVHKCVYPAFGKSQILVSLVSRHNSGMMCFGSFLLQFMSKELIPLHCLVYFLFKINILINSSCSNPPDAHNSLSISIFLKLLLKLGWFIALPVFPQKIFVMPNMDDLWLPIMHSAMDTRSNANLVTVTNDALKDPEPDESEVSDMWRLLVQWRWTFLSPCQYDKSPAPQKPRMQPWAVGQLSNIFTWIPVPLPHQSVAIH